MTLPLPTETVTEMRKQVEEMRKLTSSIVGLIYNNWLMQNMPRWAGEQVVQPFQQPGQEPKKEEDILQWYEKALKVKALQSIVGTSPESLVQQPSEKEEKKEKEEEGLGERLLKAFIEALEKNPKAAKEILDNITEEDLQKMQLLASLSEKPNPLLSWLATTKRMEKREEEPRKNETLETTKAILEALKTGVEIGKSSAPQQQGQDSLTQTLLSTVLEILKGQRDEESRRLLAGIYDALEKKENVWEKILTDENFRKNIQSLFTAQNIPTEAQIKLEELRNELVRERINLEKWIREKKLEMASEQRKLDLVKSLLEGPTGRLLSDLGKAAITGMGAGAAAGAGMGALATAKANRPQANMLAIRCGNCGTLFQVPEGTETVECPACRAMLEIKPKKQPKRKKQRVEQQEEEPESEETASSETVQ